jgi:hypothetical protein
VNGLAAFLGRLRQKTTSLLEVVGSRVLLFFPCLFPFQVALLYGFFNSFFSALIHREIIQEKTGFPAFRWVQRYGPEINGRMRPHLKMRKEQVKRLDGRDSVGQAKFVESLFGVAA